MLVNWWTTHSIHYFSVTAIFSFAYLIKSTDILSLCMVSVNDSRHHFKFVLCDALVAEA